jgi:thiol-disulfide isomerase/thioredoxin
VAVRLAPQIGALVGFSPGGERHPSWSLVTLDGDTVTSAGLRGSVVVVNFWATWCVPCRVEMPSLQKLHERHAGEDVRVLGFSVDVGSAQTVRGYLNERGITFPVGRATDAQRRAFGGIPGIPTTFVIDRTGTVRHRVVGYFAPPALEAAVSRLLREPRPPPLSGGRDAAP